VDRPPRANQLNADPADQQRRQPDQREEEGEAADELGLVLRPYARLDMGDSDLASDRFGDRRHKSIFKAHPCHATSLVIPGKD
jgi:hypothetical protein